jgi:hypothetical protein
MAQVFSPRHNLLLKLVCLGALVAIATAALAYRLNVRRDAPEHDPIEQPVPFSHQHHVRDVGLDCRYCHASVEVSAFAGLPPLATCMTCHSHLFTDQALLRPLVAAFRGGETLRWNRVHDLPDFAYFDHSIHVNKGVGCVTCHGRVDRMPLTWRVASLNMQWCIECHRAPAQQLRPREHVFDMDWHAPEDRAALGIRLMREYHIRSPAELTQCSTCHR